MRAAALLAMACAMAASSPAAAGDMYDRIARDLAEAIRTGDAAWLASQVGGPLTYSDLESQKGEPIDAARLIALTRGCSVRSKTVARMLDPAPIFIELECTGRVSAMQNCYDVGYRLVVDTASSGEPGGRLARVDHWSRARCGKQKPS